MPSQFFAANKLYENIKEHLRPNGDGKGGTYFGATGCGKSYTMLFLARMLMKSTYFSSPTILIITDRTDLDDQLSKQFVNSKKYIGDETIVSIESREKLRQELQGRTSGGVYLTTIQKFTEDLQLLTDRTNVICISDEAHRSQFNLDQKVWITESGVQRTYGFAKYLHDSLPNATYVGFTGTPVDGTIEVFGGVVDAYTMTEAVRDGITVNLVYDGRAAKVMLDEEKVRQIEEYYAQCEREGANDGIEELFETGKHISVDIFSDEYMDRINAIQLPNTKIEILQRLLSQAIDEFKKVNKIMGVEFADRLKRVVDEYNNRRQDEAYANEVLDDVAEQLAQLLLELNVRLPSTV